MTTTPDPTVAAPAATSLPPQPVGFPPTAVARPSGPVGTVRSTGTSILLFLVTLGIYGIVWHVKVHGEMKRHRNGDGLGAGLVIVLQLFLSPVLIFLTPAKVGALYADRGQEAPVSGKTGFWVFLPLVGGIVWFVKINGALNDYWRSLGAR